MRGWIAVLVCASGCYTGARTSRDVNAAWRGRHHSEIEAAWGKPAAVQPQADGTTAFVWSHVRRHVDLPSGGFDLRIDPNGFDLTAEVQPGAVWRTETNVAALVDAQGLIAGVTGPSLRWGPPNDANIHWGTLLGLHVGMGRLDDTSTALPSGGVYIGGMITRTHGLVGCFSLVAGTDDDGAAMGFAWGMGVQWWIATRTWLRAGPALVLAFDPGFEDAALEAGITGGASYAIVKSGTFALDLRLDLTTTPSTSFGSVGLGVNLN